MAGGQPGLQCVFLTRVRKKRKINACVWQKLPLSVSALCAWRGNSRDPRARLARLAQWSAGRAWRVDVAAGGQARLGATWRGRGPCEQYARVRLRRETAAGNFRPLFHAAAFDYIILNWIIRRGSFGVTAVAGFRQGQAADLFFGNRQQMQWPAIKV